MKLEDVIDKNRINAIDLLGKDVRITIENMLDVTKLSKYNANLIADGLGETAVYTRDKDTVLEAARTIGKYDGEAARNIARKLGEIAFHSKNKDEVISVAEIMSLDEIVSTINSKGQAAGDIAYGLGETAVYTRDKDTVLEAARTIGKYDGEAACNIAQKLGEIAFDSKNKDIVRIAYDIVGKIGSGALDKLDSKDLAIIKEKGLEKLIINKDDLTVINIYFRSDGELPPPTKNNISTYGNIASDYISRTYGINKKLSLDNIFMLFSVEKRDIKGLAKLVNRSVERNIKEYSISIEGSKPIYMDKEKLPYFLLISVTGSRDKNKDKEALDNISSIVGDKTIRRARNSFNSHYKYLIKEIASHINKGEVDKAISLLMNTNDESITDVLSYKNYRDINNLNRNSNGRLLRAVESNNPLDYNSNVQMACVYLPNGHRNGIYNYCNDYYSESKGFILTRYDIGNQPVGSAICYMEGDKFLVDSVEGHRIVRKPQVFDAIYKDLISRAKEKGAKQIIFSKSGLNETPEKFIDYLGKLGLKKGTMRMELDTRGYLEAGKNVKGYILKLD